MLKYPFGVVFLVFFFSSRAQLKPGFDAEEYIGLFSLTPEGSMMPDRAEKRHIDSIYKFKYQSPEVGFNNQWSYYVRNDQVGIITIRGTVGNKESWLANFYAAMIPAMGTLQISDTTKFGYKLSRDTNANVHVGWTVGMAFLAPDIVRMVNDQYAKGIRSFLIFGHSQGGAIAYLLTSYLYYLKEGNSIPHDIQFKTYCSAAPKPGNMNYAYDFEFLTRNGWAFTIINAYDWVPESPYTVQRMQDMNSVNPLIHTKDGLKKTKWYMRLIGNKFYNKVNRKTTDVQKMYTNLFGNRLYNVSVKKSLKGFQKPTYAPSSNFMRAGTPIVLMPDNDYKKRFSDTTANYFIHHSFQAYYFLIKKYYK